MKLGILLVLACCSFGVSAQWVHFPQDARNGTRVEVGNLSVTGTAITVEAMVTEQPGANPLMDIVSKHFSQVDANYLLRGTNFLIRTSKGTVSVDNPIKLCPNTPYHVAGTYDGKVVNYYVNGVKVASKPWSGNLNVNNDITAIGNLSQGGSAYITQYHGYISEVKIWKVARTPAQIIATMYATPQPASQPGLLAYYTFRGTLKNKQGNTAWDGKASNATVVLADNPFFKGEVSFNFCGGGELKPPTSFAPQALDDVTMNFPKADEAPKKPVIVAKVPARPVSADTTTAGKTEKSTHLTVEVWDFDGIDGDSISLKLNGRPIGPAKIGLPAYKTYGSPEFTYALDIQPDDTNMLEITAVSEGSRPFTTVGLLMMRDQKGKKIYFRLKAGERAVIRLLRM